MNLHSDTSNVSSKHLEISSNINRKLSEAGDVDKRFAWIEELRKGALEKLKSVMHAQHNGGKSNVADLFNEESIAMQRQFEVLDRGIYLCLKVEGRTDAYDQWTSEEDHDLPSNPADLADDREAYKYALKRLYRRQFEVTLNEIKTGCWPLLLADLLEPLDGKRSLAVSDAPLAIANHSSAEYLRAMTSVSIGNYTTVFQKAKNELTQRLAELSQKEEPLKLEAKNAVVAGVIIAAIATIAQVVDVTYRIYRDVQDREQKEKEAREAKEAAERAAKEKAAREAQARAEKQMRDWARDPKELKGSSDHCDSFERNRDRISRTC